MLDLKPDSIAPFDGTVNASHSSAVVASTSSALVARDSGDREVFLVPVGDVHFELLRQGPERRTGLGTATEWNTSAVGEAARAVIWTIDAPAAGLDRLVGHAVLDHAGLEIEATPTPDRLHRTEWP